MTDGELIGKVHSAMYHQCQSRGYVAPVDVLMDIGVLPKQKYEDWRFGRVPYLEGRLYGQSPQAVVYHAPDACLCREIRSETVLLLL